MHESAREKLTWILGLLMLLGVYGAASVPRAAESDAALLAALRQGGYALVIRHASSPHDPPDRESADPENRELERQLDAKGRETAAAMGDAIRALELPIGDVFTSPTYRARETARLAGLSNPRPEAALGDGGRSMSGVTESQTTWLQEHVRQWAKGKNTVFVTHLPNMKAAFPDWSGDLGDGDTLVLGPDGSGGVTLVGRIAIDHWPQMR